MAFQVEVVAYELIGALRAVVARVKSRDRALADQLARAASSVALNIAESNYSDPGNRRARLFTKNLATRHLRRAANYPPASTGRVPRCATTSASFCS